MNTASEKQGCRKFQVQFAGKGLAVGITAGSVVVLYRIALVYDGKWLSAVLHRIQGNPIRIAVWFLLLFLLAVVTGFLIKWEPQISGSGLPQLEGELLGKLDQKWKRILPAKFVGGTLALAGGLSLGRGGPSMQMGALAGKGLSQILKWDKDTEKHILICGACAGFSAAFHAPLAGVIFLLEEIRKDISVSVLVPMIISAFSADFVSMHFIGQAPIFGVVIEGALPGNEYWLLLPLGIVLGVTGVFYQKSLMRTKRFYQSLDRIGVTGKLLIPFMTAGILGVIAPELLGSGGTLLPDLAKGNMVLGSLLLLIVGKFFFTMISAASGAPGGLFFPLFILGAMLGSVFAMFSIRYLGMNSIYINNFILLAITGYFAAIFRTPVTGIVLICENLGSVHYILTLGIVSVISYVTARFLRSESVCESLLKDLLER